MESPPTPPIDLTGEPRPIPFASQWDTEFYVEFYLIFPSLNFQL